MLWALGKAPASELKETIFFSTQFVQTHILWPSCWNWDDTVTHLEDLTEVKKKTGHNYNPEPGDQAGPHERSPSLVGVDDYIQANRPVKPQREGGGKKPRGAPPVPPK